MPKARPGTHELRREPPATNGGSSSAPGPALLLLCLVVALTPLVFAATLFDPYTGAKEILIAFGAPTVLLLWLFTTRLDSMIATPLWLPLIGLAAIGLASAFWSSNPPVSLATAWHFLPYFLLFAAALHLMRRREARTELATALMLAGSIEAVYVLQQFAFGDPIFLTEGLRGKWQTFGTFGNPNWAGEFLAAAAMVTLGRVIELGREPATSPWLRRAATTAFVLILLGLTATLARGAWLGFTIGTISFFLLLRRTHHRFPWKKVSPVVISGLAAAAGLLVSVFLKNETLGYLLNLKSLRGRIWIWAMTTDMIRDAPVLGHGLGTFRLEFPLYQANAFAAPWSTPFIANASFTSFAHNDFLQAGAELGLLGLVALGGVIWMLLRRGRMSAAKPIVLGCWAAMISLLVNALIAFPMHLPTSLMLFAIFAAVIEATAVKTSQIKAKFRGLRPALAILLMFACAMAYYSGYQRLITESALWRAEAGFQARDRQEAEASAIAAIEHAPTRPDGYAILGRIRLEDGDHAEAIYLFDRAIKLGFNADVYGDKATALEKTGQIEAAVAVMTELVRLRPDLGPARQRLADLDKSATDPEENPP